MSASRSWLCVLGTIAFSVSLKSPSAATDPGVLYFDAWAIAARQIGDSVELRGVLFHGSVPPPLPLDFDAFEHTMVFASQLIATRDGVEIYAPATIAVYSDVRATGTVADPAQPGTYTDGDCILLARFRDLVHSNFGSPGYVTGYFDLTGGSRLHEVVFPPSILGAAWETVDAPAGYHEAWHGQMFYDDPNGIEQRTWSVVKALYREGAPAPR